MPNEVEGSFESRESSNVGGARYRDGKLQVDFKDKDGHKRSTYEYDGALAANPAENPTGRFPVEEWQAFCTAESKGKHFAYKIRPKYRGIRIA